MCLYKLRSYTHLKLNHEAAKALRTLQYVKQNLQNNLDFFAKINVVKSSRDLINYSQGPYVGPMLIPNIGEKKWQKRNEFGGK